jgi:hypothetical protein
MKPLMPWLLALALVGCSTTETPKIATGADPARPPAAGTPVTQAAVTPLSDLNIVRAEIPPVLAAAQKAPYTAPSDAACTGLRAEIEALDGVLGPDLDAPVTPSNPGLVERGAGAVGNAATGAIRGAAEGVIPFRGWVRKLSGAERYERKVAAAIAAGSVRRAYLKGLGQAAGCAAPAAPRR